MHDTLDYIGQRADPPPVPPRPDDLLADVRLHRELRAADQPRRGRARQGLAAAQDARRPLAAAGQPARLPRLHVGPPRQAAALHGLASSARRPSGPRPAASTGGCSTSPAHRGVHAAGHATSTALYRARPALWALDPDPAGFEWIDANDAAGQHVLVPALRRADRDGAAAGLRRQLLRHPARRLPRRPAARRAAGTRCSTPTPRATAARASATSASVVAEEVPWHGQPARPLVPLPPLGAVWLEPAERVVPARRGRSATAAASRRRHVRTDRQHDHDRRHVAVRGPDRGGVLLRWHVGVRGTRTSSGPSGVVPAAGSEADASTRHAVHAVEPTPRRPPAGPAPPLPRRSARPRRSEP